MIRVLIRLPNHVGDACMSLPAIDALQTAGCQCVLVGPAWGDSLFAGLRLPYRMIEGRVLHDRARLRALDVSGTRALILPNSFGSALAFRLAGVPSAGFATDGRRMLLTWPSLDPGPLHEVERFYTAATAALHAWGLPDAGPVPMSLGLRTTNEQHVQARATLDACGVAQPYVLMAPVATGLHQGQAKHWEHFDELVPVLHERGLHAVAAPPAREADAVRSALPGATLLPPVALGVYAALADGASLVIANDSGSSHVAAAVGAPQVTIFGVTDRARTGPWSPKAVCVGENGAWPDVADVTGAIDRALELSVPESE